MTASLFSGPHPRRVLVAVSGFERTEFQIDRAFEGFTGAELEVQVCTSETPPAAWSRLLTTIRPEVLVVGWAAPALPEGYLDAPDCPVRYIAFLTGSVRRLVPRSFLESGGRVTNWGDAAAPMVAEHALLLLLAALRRLPQWQPFLNLSASAQNAHPMPLATRTLHGRTVSLHGFGQIARQLIRLLAPFNVRVRAFSAGVPADYIRTHGAEPVASLAELFAGADTFVEVEALTPSTRGSVTATLIDSLAPDAVFVNVGRGAVADEAALARRAARGDLQLALDVLEVEPLPTDSPLRDLPDALISPHIGGPTRDQLPAFAARAADNIRRYLIAQPLLQPLTTEIYDRST